MNNTASSVRSALIVLSFYYLGKTEETYAETWKAERERHL